MRRHGGDFQCQLNLFEERIGQSALVSVYSLAKSLEHPDIPYRPKGFSSGENHSLHFSLTLFALLSPPLWSRLIRSRC